MRTPFAPLHLLFFAEAVAHDLVHSRLHKARGYCLTIPIPLAIIRDQVRIVHDIRAKLLYCLEQRLELWIGLFEVVEQRLDVIDFIERLVEIAMLQWFMPHFGDS